MTAPRPLDADQRSGIAATVESKRRRLARARADLRAAQARLAKLRRQRRRGTRWKILVGGWLLEAAKHSPATRAWLDAELDKALTNGRDRRLLEEWRLPRQFPDE